MRKFKAGDQVRCINDGGSGLTAGEIYEVERADEEFAHVMVRGFSGGYYHYRFELVTPNGPVREVTRKEIVAGRYGCVSVVSPTNGDRVQLRFETTCEGLSSWYDAAELRAAADVLTQLADALEPKP